MADRKDIGLGIVIKGKVDRSLQRTVTSIATSLNGLTKQVAGFAAPTKRASSSVSAFDQLLGKLRTNLKGNASLMGSAVRAANDLANMHGKGTAEVLNYGGALIKATKDVVNETQAQHKGTGVVQAKVKAVDLVTKATSRMEKAVGKSNGIFSVMNKQLGKITGGFSHMVVSAMGVTAAYKIASTILSFFTNLLFVGAEGIVAYDQALKNLQAITGTTDAQIKIMGQTIQDVASVTKFSVTEIAEAMVLLGQSGLTAAETIKTIESVANLATGTLSSMAATADLITTAIRAYGLEADNSARISDIFASAVNRSKLTIDKLRVAFNFLAPVAAKAGVSLEDTATAAMVLANSGVRASTIGTGLRQVIARLISPSTKLRAAFQAAGADLNKLNPLINDFGSVINELGKVVLSSEQAFRLFGLRGAPAVAALTTAGSVGFAKMRKEVERSGVAAMMAEKQLEGLAAQYKNMTDKAGVLAVAVGEQGVAGVFRILIVLARNVLEVMTTFIRSPIGGFFTNLTIVVTGLGTALLALAGIILVSGPLGKAFAFLALQLAPAGSIIWGLLAVVTGIAAVATAFHLAKSDIEEATEALLVFDNATISIEKYEKRLLSVEEGSKEYKDVNITLRKEMLDVASAGGVLSQQALDVATSITAAGEASTVTITKLDLLQKALIVKQLQSHIVVVNDSIKAYEKQKRFIAILKANFDELSYTVGMTSDEIAKHEKKLDKEKELLRGANTQIQAMAASFIELGIANGKLALDDSAAKWRNLALAMGVSEGGTDVFRVAIGNVLSDMKKAANAMPAYWAEIMGVTGTTDVEIANKQWELMMKRFPNVAKTVSEEVKSTFLALPPALRKSMSSTFEAAEVHREGLENIFKDSGERIKAIELANGRIIAQQTRLLNNERIAEERNAYETKKQELENSLQTTIEILNEKHQTELHLKKYTAEQIKAIDKKYAGKKREAELATLHLKTTNELSFLDFIKSALGTLDVMYTDQQKSYTQAQHSEGIKRRRNTTAELKAESDALKQEAKDEKAALNTFTKQKEIEVSLRVKKIKAAVASNNKTELEGMRDILRVRERLWQKELVRLQKVQIEKIKIYGVGHKESINATTAVMVAEGKLVDIIAQGTLLIKKSFDEIKKGHEEGTVSVNEYVSALKVSFERGFVSYKTFITEQTALTKSWFDNLILGLQYSSLEIESLGETWQRVGSEVANQIADNMVSNIWDFANGTKSAGEAFRDFAKETLSWLWKIILRQQILNALQGIAPKLFGPKSVPLDPNGMTIGLPAMPAIKHTGGLIGTIAGNAVNRMVDSNIFVGAQKYHNGGLANDDVPIIAKRGEGIFTPEQMKAMGDVGGGTTNISINVENKTGGDVKASQERPRFDGKRWVVNMLLEAKQENIGGIASILPGGIV